ncbi:MAG TPA: oxygenase MpaB family protein [Vicinamibacterales bacterium]
MNARTVNAGLRFRFGEAPVLWRVNAERLMLLGWSRAILLQLAHPLVAAGVAEHSTFRGGPLTAVARLHHTVRAMLALTFGDASAQQRSLDTIRAIHRRVHGRLPHAVGRFAAGTPYSAEDPALLLWVHATLVDSVLLVYDRVVSPLSTAERDVYCAEASGVAVALGARDQEVPRTQEALHQYVSATLGSGAIAVGGQARELAEAVLAPPLGFVTWPAARVNQLVTAGLLPAAVREQYGFRWDANARRTLEAILRLIRGTRRALPRSIAWWPDARG